MDIHINLNTWLSVGTWFFCILGILSLVPCLLFSTSYHTTKREYYLLASIALWPILAIISSIVGQLVYHYANQPIGVAIVYFPVAHFIFLFLFAFFSHFSSSLTAPIKN